MNITVTATAIPPPVTYVQLKANEYKCSFGNSMMSDKLDFCESS